MARIKYSALVSSINGSIGGSTFQSNQYGFTVRSKPLQIANFGENQLNILRIMSSSRSAWSTLTANQKKQWEIFSSLRPHYATHNKSSLLSGYNLFLKYNTVRQLAGLSILTDFAFVADQVVFETPQIFNNTGDVYLNFSPAFDQSKFSFIARASRYFKRNTSLAGVPFRLMDPILITGNDFSITASYLSAFGRTPRFGEVVCSETTIFSLVAPIVSGKLLSKPWIW